MIELVFKKYFWVFTATTTAVLALLTALGVNAWIEGRIRGLARSGEVAVPTVDGAEDPAAGLRANPQGLANALTERRVFNADPPPKPEGEEPEEDEPDEGPGEEVDESAEIEETDLNVELLGTMVSPDPAWSMASITIDGENKLIREGMSVNDSFTIDTIARTYVLLERRGTKEVVKLWAEKAGGGGSRFNRAGSSRNKPGRYTPPSTRRSPSKRPTTSIKNAYEEGVAKVGEREWKIDRSMLEEQLNDLTKLGMQARVVPNYVGGKYQGFKLVGVRPNSLYRAIGIRSGDIIKRINGMEIDSPNKALQLFEKLRNSRRITLDVQRAGQNQTFYYTVQ